MKQHDAAEPQEDEMALQTAVTEAGLTVVVGLGIGLVPPTAAAPPIRLGNA